MADGDAAHLARSLELIRVQEAQMRKALGQQGRLLVALKNAATMLGELRTSALTPKQYYELYTACFDVLVMLGGYLREDHKNHHMGDIYEIVQYTGNVLPRLYLLVTAGTAYLATSEAPSQEVLKDMLEMCRGVQHPMRGLFLRYFLGQQTASFLPTSTPAELYSSIQFTLTNFVEMNKLWVRLQHVGHSRDRAKRTAERSELQIIVGSSILRLAQLDGVDLHIFQERIWPELASQIGQCHDALAQEYLLDVVTQAFPAEFHVETLQQFLDILPDLVPETSRRMVLLVSIQRALCYAAEVSALSASSKETVASKEESAASKEENAALKEESVASKEESVASKEESVASKEESVASKEESAASKEESSDLKEDTAAQSGDDSMAENAAIQDSVSENRVGNADSVESRKRTNVRDSANPGENDKDETSLDSPPIENVPISPQPDKKSSTAPEMQESEEESKNSATDTDAMKPQPDNVSPKPISKAQTVIEAALRGYDGVIKQINFSASDRAAIALPLAKFAQQATKKDHLAQYVAWVAEAAQLEPSIEVETLLLSLFAEATLIEVLEILKENKALVSSQSKETRERIAQSVLKEVISSGTTISDSDIASHVFELFSLLLKSGDADPVRLAEVVHLLGGETKAMTLRLLQLAHRWLRDGGPLIVRRTYGSVASAAIRVLRDRSEPPDADLDLLKFVNRTIRDLAIIGDSPDHAFRLYVLAAAAADARTHEEAAYEFWAQAFSLYEESISESHAQIAALATATGTLQIANTSLSRDNYEVLAARLTQYAGRLLHKTDQCTAVLRASHLWLPDLERLENPAKVVETLQRALRIADAMVDADASLELFCDILDRYAFYVVLDVPTITPHDIGELVRLIRRNADSAEGLAAVTAHQRTNEIITSLERENVQF